MTKTYPITCFWAQPYGHSEDSAPQQLTIQFHRMELYFTVEHCDGLGKVENLFSISQNKPNLPSYTVSCDPQFELLNGHRTYECRNQEWFPVVSCVSKYEQSNFSGDTNTPSYTLYGKSII